MGRYENDQNVFHEAQRKNIEKIQRLLTFRKKKRVPGTVAAAAAAASTSAATTTKSQIKSKKTKSSTEIDLRKLEEGHV
jgi:hypothetical protein